MVTDSNKNTTFDSVVFLSLLPASLINEAYPTQSQSHKQ